MLTGLGDHVNRFRFRPYPAYKDSGVEWLGKVPEHWGVHKLKDHGDLMGGAGFPHEYQWIEGEELPFYKVGDLVLAPDGKTLGMPPHSINRAIASELRARVIPQGSIVYAKIGAALYLNRRRITYMPCCIDNNMTAFIPRQTKVSSEWSYYWMTILDFGGFANPGAVPSLSEGYQSTLPLLTPPVQEQIAVAAFLDRETARIDELVAKKERLITMLQEKRAALITHTVTKGLESNVPMKDSRVGWTEHVPEHWSVAPVYSRYEVQLGKMLDEKQISGKCLAPYLRNVDVQWDRINASDLPLMDFNMGDRQRFLLRAGDLLVCEGGEVGRAAIWSGELEECFYQKALHRVRPHLDRDDPRFLFYLLYAASKNDAFVVEGNQTTIGHLTAEKLRRQRFPFPSRKEQTEIASFLDREAPKIDALIAKVNEAIGRLKEYRTALISTAVTGKIDVREDV